MQRIILLLTGTIRPLVSDTSVQPDAVVRAHEYRHALTSAATQLAGTNTRIIFAENSGHDPIGLFAHCRGIGIEVRVIPDSDQAAVRGGKGAGELALMRGVIESAEFADAQMFIKATGRLEIVNLAAFVHDAARATYDASFRLDRRSGFSDSRIFIFRKRYFTILDAAGRAIDDAGGLHLEHSLAQTVALAQRQGLRWRFLSVFPRFRGYSGTNGNSYFTSAWAERVQWLKFHLFRLADYFCAGPRG